MKKKIRLFTAASIGAIIGGYVTHWFIEIFGVKVSIPLQLLFLVFGIASGALVAAFIYDPRGSREVCGNALGETVVLVTVSSFATTTWVFISIARLIELALRMVVALATIIINAATWFVFFFCVFLSVWRFSPSLLQIALASGFLSLVSAVALFGAAREFRRFDERSLKEFCSCAWSGCLKTNAFNVVYQILKGLWFILIHLGDIVRTLIFFGVTLIVLTVFFLSECRMRSMAMVGATIGVLLGFVWWNPIIVGLMGGVSAVCIHQAIAFLDKTIRSGWFEKSMEIIIPKYLKKPRLDYKSTERA